MRIEKFFAAVFALACVAGMGITALAEDYFPLEGDDDILEEEAEAVYDEPRKGEGYYVSYISFRDGAPEIHDENGNIYDLWGEIDGYMQEGETREDVEKDTAESMREQLAAIGANPDDYGFDVYTYFYDDYDFTPDEFFDFIYDDIARRGTASAIAEDDDEFEESMYDRIRKGERYYVSHISYHGGIPEIYDEDGNLYDFFEEEAGFMHEGETRESIELTNIEFVREQIAATGANPDDYGFDVYTYFYDDYDLTPEEFLNFVNEDILRRDSERDKPITDVPNPVTGTGLPLTAAVLAAFSGAGILAVGRKKLS